MNSSRGGRNGLVTYKGVSSLMTHSRDPFFKVDTLLSCRTEISQETNGGGNCQPLTIWQYLAASRCSNISFTYPSSENALLAASAAAWIFSAMSGSARQEFTV